MAALLLATSLSAQEYRDVTPEHEVNLPRDFFFRPDYKVQWWYFTGHLYDETGREYGYELTFFVVGIQKRPYRSQFGVLNAYISHFAVSDVQGKKFIYHDRIDSGGFGFSGADTAALKVWVEGNRIEGDPRKMTLIASGSDAALDLVLVPEKPLVLHGRRGYSRKSEESPLHASMYFSYTSLQTSGTLTVSGKQFAVSGKSWFDREISSRALGKDIAGWDWFALNLDDNREVMLYLLRKKDGTVDPFSAGTVVSGDGRTRHLQWGEFSVSVLSRYRSDKTGARYSSRWSVVIPSEALHVIVAPLIRDQEFVADSSTLNHYWEGTCSVEGSVTGRAYVEMTGY
ncbi:MAG: lipocalin-like domain-containing protein [Chloroflexota bacterium]